MMKRIPQVAAIALALVFAPKAFSQILFDNASTLPGAGTYGLVSNPNAGFGGNHLSVLISGTEGTFGFTANTSTAFRIADDFTVPAGFTWTITGANFFDYTTGATTPTLIGATIRFFNGNPSTGGTVFAGDTTTNVQTSAGFALDGATSIYRASSATPTDSNRRIQISTSTLTGPVILGPGTYWIDYALTSSTGAVFSPPMALSTAAVTGDALQFNGTSWVAMVDGTSLNAKGMPFQLIGTSAAIPEPGTWALLGLTVVGATGFAYRRRLKRELALEGKLKR
ncbi:MAG: PEP-CTERM sorting domain-containing protein [Planctomycetia bacterium]|nr:PEP-CTERM sorting domain-containing protein [Planctomycetia bacterium]